MAGAARWGRALPPLIFVTLALLSLSDFTVGFFNDDVVYIALARSLLHGTGARDIFLLGNPPHSHQPLGYPLLLSATMLLFPNSLLALQLVSVSACVVALLAVDRATRGVLSTGEQFVLLLLCALNTVTLRFSGAILSDPLFLAITWGAMAAWVRDPLTSRRAVWLGVILAAAVWVRTVGGLLLVVLAADGLRRRLPRQTLAALLGGSAVLLVPLQLLGPSSGYRNWILNRWAEDGGSVLMATVANLKFYAANLPAALLGEPAVLSEGMGTPLLAIVALTLGALAIRGAYTGAQQGLGWSLAWLLIYSTVILLWPYQDMRFFVAAYPMIYLLIVLGLRALPRRLGSGVLAAMLLFQLAFAGVLLHDSWYGSYRNRLPLKTYAWLGQHAAPDCAVLSFRYAPYLYCNRQVVPMPDVSVPSAKLLRNLLCGGAGALLLEPARNVDESTLYFFARSFRGMLAAFPAVFQLAHEEADEGTAVFWIAEQPKQRLLGALDLIERASAAPNPAALLEQALGLEPTLFPARYQQAQLYLHLGDPAAALREAQTLQREAPWFMSSYYLQFAVASSTHDAAGARAALDAALQASRVWYGGLFDSAVQQGRFPI